MVSGETNRPMAGSYAREAYQYNPAASSSIWPVNLRSVFRLLPVSRSSP